MFNYKKKHKNLKLVLAVLFILINTIIILACADCRTLSKDKDIHYSDAQHACCKNNPSHHKNQKKSCDCEKNLTFTKSYPNNYTNNQKELLVDYSGLKLPHTLFRVKLNNINNLNLVLCNIASKQNSPPIFIRDCSFVI